jgi:uncharacterized membrane protein
MKKIEMQLRKGNWHNVSLFIVIILSIIYLVNELFVFPVSSRGVWPTFDFKPCNLVVLKCCYALLMIIGILRIRKESSFYWFMLNLASVGVLSICYFNSLLTD